MTPGPSAANLRRARTITRIAPALFLLALLAVFPRKAGGRTDRVNLFPRLHAGQTVSYQLSFRSSRQVKTESAVVMAQAPGDATIDEHAAVRLEVLGVEPQAQRATIHARAWFQDLDAPTDSPSGSPQNPHPAGVPLEFAIFPSGGIDPVKGLDALSQDQQQAWRQWVSQFAIAATFPAGGVKVGQKWKSEQIERSPSPIASLMWVRESTYVRNEPCRPMRMTQQGDVLESDQPPESCAVILTVATLRQRSHAKDTTPDDYRVRQLHTSGTVRGNNRTITYISLKTGLIVRSSDEADQSMAVTIAKAAATNRVRYDVQAKSAAEVLLVTTAPSANANPQKNP